MNQLNCIISYFFQLRLMLHACVRKFDMTGVGDRYLRRCYTRRLLARRQMLLTLFHDLRSALGVSLLIGRSKDSLGCTTPAEVICMKAALLDASKGRRRRRPSTPSQRGVAWRAERTRGLWKPSEERRKRADLDSEKLAWRKRLFNSEARND